MISLLVALFAHGSTNVNSITTRLYDVENNTIVLFDSKADADSFNVESCRNSVAISRKLLRKIISAKNNYQNVKFKFKIMKDYFKSHIPQDVTSYHYVFKGQPLNDICASRDLVVILTATKP